ncbi:M10 family metallopeptidase C-terminal domain-containing protein [Pleurocapsales cyanobacterium LEGE 10410]|nr:M10 family metallopeptidase C-terminal domain-containing protein [Pleurocapsales cyanobacterium LEGE 10410]
MSSIVSIENPDLGFETTIVGSQLEIIGQQGEENIIEVKGDSPITIIGGALGDTVMDGAGDATIFTGDGNDMISGGNGDDILIGGEGEDTILGGLGADFISGGAGNDIIRSGLPGMDSNGNPMGDTLRGGAGEDVFEFTADEFESGGIDEISDFEAGVDKITIFGVSNGSVNYNQDTGIISIKGEAAIDVGTDLDIDESKKGDTDTWELF